MNEAERAELRADLVAIVARLDATARGGGGAAAVDLSRVCVSCGGRGRVPLTGVAAATLAKVRSLIASGALAYVVAGVEFERFGCGANALSNRLARLAAAGLLNVERHGVEKRYTVATRGECRK